MAHGPSNDSTNAKAPCVPVTIHCCAKLVFLANVTNEILVFFLLLLYKPSVDIYFFYTPPIDNHDVEIYASTTADISFNSRAALNSTDQS
jgi:hypothetical protein